MEILYAGHGKVGDRCRKVLDELGVRHESIEFANAAHPWDLLLSVHWPHKFMKLQLSGLKIGGLNLHNSFLPWNKGAHACSWAIVDQTPHGATMHWMDEEFDTGDIFCQRELTLQIDESADHLYKRTADLEVELFREGIGMVQRGEFPRIRQRGSGSWHTKKDFERLVRAVQTSETRVIRV